MSWAIRAAESLMARKETLTDRWAYEYGVAFKGFAYVYEITKDTRFLDYVDKTMDFFVQDDGSIKMYSPDEFNIDHINNGKLFYWLYDHTGKDKYLKAANYMYKQLESHPRTSEGVFWHKEIYPYQIWLDGLYMGAPFYAEHLARSGETDFSDVVKQFVICEKHTLDEKTGLLYHAWDETRSMFWANPETGCSENFWGRSMGWFVMALVDVLDFIPEGAEGHSTLVSMLKRTLNALLNVQDTSGCWFQVLDQGLRKGNYLESSASCMVAYALAKGILKNYLQRESYLPALHKAYKGIIDEFILLTNEGLVNVNKVCEVAGLGNKEKRDGSFTYYISEPIVCNDLKGYGAFIQMAAMVEMLEL